MIRAFGVELNPNSSNTNPFRFAGEYWDHIAQTYYLRARNFDPRVGRFTSPDPHWGIHNMIFGDSPTLRNNRNMPSIHAIIQAGNLYVYTINNPVRWVDSSGLMIYCPQFIKKAVQAGAKYGQQLGKWFIDESKMFGRWFVDVHVSAGRSIGKQARCGWDFVSGLFGRGGATTVNVREKLLSSVQNSRLSNIINQ